jgi:chromosome segregation protein
MYFKKLEIFGFKSFAEKTVLNFEPGITAIVGPNGCGKSNIFDAIRWVLGEQSMKELRGGAKEDVIFNGTESKAPLGFAEVHVTFCNESRMLPIEQPEVVIARRIYRSGESEYLLNHNVVRLKDIQELLMGTGIGAEAYSLVQQGRVDLVVSARPEDRRMILDEAAGITKYKAKKREATNKLKSTEDNLLRLNDIILEVKRQIGSIERQANKARKYKEEYEKLKQGEIKLALHQMETFCEKRNKIETEMNALRQKEQDLIRESQDSENQLDQQTVLLEETEQKINELHGEEIKLDSQTDLNNRQIGFNQERIESLSQQIFQINEKKAQLIERCRTQQDKLEELRASLSTIKGALQNNEQLLIEQNDHLALLERKIKEARESIVENEEKVLSMTSKQVSVRNGLTDIMKEFQGCLARKRRLEMEFEKVSREKGEVDQKLQHAEFQINSTQGNIIDLRHEKDSSEKKLSGLRAQLQELDRQINELEKKKFFFKSQKDFIEKLQAQYQDIPDPVIEGRFFTDHAPAPHHTGIIGKVKHSKNIPWNRVPYLQEALSIPEGKDLYEIICETKFIELDPQQVQAKIDEIDQEVAALTQAKQDVQQQIKEEIVVVQGLEEQLIQKEKMGSILAAQRNDIVTEADKISSEIDLLNVELNEVKETLTSSKKKEDELNYELDTINQEIGWCQNDMKNKQAAISARLQEKEQTQVMIAHLKTEIDSTRDKIQSQEDNLNLFSETLDSWLEEIKKIEDECVSNQLKTEQYVAEIGTLRATIEEIKQSKESLRAVVAESEALKNEMSQQIKSLQSQRGFLENGMDEVRQQMHAQELVVQEVGFGDQGIKDRLWQTYKIQWDEVKPLQAHPIQDPVAEGAAVVEEAHVPAAAGLPINEEELLAEIERLKKRCDSYGTVNLVAIEEYEELKQRFEFLTKQQSDLLSAKDQLMETIRKINRTTRQLFLDTFTKVSQEFRIYFRMLFGGGDAELILLDQENVLESGIDIVARPPGKKLQNISLMSGGEKTLTAIALIFGVFKANPSPFCVLDEIDAALDEANVGRFSYLLKDFSKIAQFIVITHNKKTMMSSDIMYGITMPETGVSRIVSVKLSDEKKKEAVAEVPVAA